MKIYLTTEREKWEQAYFAKRAWILAGTGLRGCYIPRVPKPIDPIFLWLARKMPREAWWALLDGQFLPTNLAWIKRKRKKGGVLLVSPQFSDFLKDLQAYVDQL